MALSACPAQQRCLAPAGGADAGAAPVEPRIEKHYGNAFEDTALEQQLAQLKVGRLLVAGAETDACIRSTLQGALVRG